MDLDRLVTLLAGGVGSNSFEGVFWFLLGDGDLRVRVWRHGRLARVEQLDGHVEFIAGHNTNWLATDRRKPLVGWDRDLSRDDVEWGPLANLDPVGYWHGWLTRDPELVTRTLHRVTHAGRRAWRFTAPSVKGGETDLVVDEVLGLVLLAERPDVGAVQSWTDLVVGKPGGDIRFEPDPVWQPDGPFTHLTKESG